MKKTLAVLSAAAAALVMAGCATNTHEPVDLVKFQQTAKVDTVWTKSLGAAPGMFLAPAVADNAVYAAGSNRVYRLDPATGSEVWEAKMASDVTQGVATDGFVVAVGLADGTLSVLNAEGKALWTKPVPGGVEGTPLVGRKMVVARAGDGHVTAYEATSGKQLWTFQRQNPALMLHAPQGGAFIGDWIVVGQANGRLLALNSKGIQAWQAVIAQPHGTNETERMVDVLGVPVATDDMICAASYQGRITCMNRKNGTPVWTTKVNAVDGPSHLAGNIAVSDQRGAVHLWREATGGKLWTNDKLLWRATSGPLVTDKAVVVGDYDGYIHFLSPKNGEFIARESLSGAVAVAPVALPDRGILVQTQKGRLALLKVE